MVLSDINYTPSDSSYGMEVFLTFLLLFMVGCMLGYVIELLFRRFVTAKKWVNPGFMKGPWLPLYGFGLVLLFFLSWLMYTVIPESLPLYNPIGMLFGRGEASLATVYDLIPILTMTCGMVLLEFIAGLIFVKGFKVRLWDYTNMKGNILGIICPVFSLMWFMIAVIYYYALNPFVYDGFMYAFSYIFGEGDTTGAAHFGIVFVLGIGYGIFLIDLVQSIGLFRRITKLARSSGIVARYEKMKEDNKRQRAIYKQKIVDALPESLKRNMEKDKLMATEKKASSFIRKLVLIDPDQKKKDNYDESGRPAKIEDSQNEKPE